MTQGSLKVYSGMFFVYSDNPHSRQKFDWQVTAVRADVELLDVEPLKSEILVKGDGPYTYAVGRE